MWQHFSYREFECKCGCGGNEIQAGFVNKLDALRKALGFPMTVTSGYRCPSYNIQVSGTGDDGPHTTGRAVDIYCRGEQALEIVSAARRFGFTGIGVKQKGKYRFIHLDDLTGGARPTIWSY